MSKRDDTSSNRRAQIPSLYVALGAIFLFVLIGVSVYSFSSHSTAQVNMLLLAQASRVSDDLPMPQVRHDQGAAVAETPELVLVSKTSMVAVSPPRAVSASVLGALVGGSSISAIQSREISDYVAEEGDTISSLAERFRVSSNTILWANDLESSSPLVPGQRLIILPVSGALHLVRPGDTPSEIALWYKADIEEILEFNGVESPDRIFVGDLLIIPGGTKPATLPSGRLTRLPGSYFIMPVPSSYRITQGLHPFNAIDFSNGACGGPAYAAAGGIVQRVGFDRVGGNYVRILHPNGVVTFYGHLSGQAISLGEKVLQGQIVGYIGHSGYTIPVGSAGCHLHFEVRGAYNPFAK